MKTFAVLMLLLLAATVQGQTYDERAQLALQVAVQQYRPSPGPSTAPRPTAYGIPYVTEDNVYDSVPANAPPGSISVAEMHRRAAASGLAGRYSGVAGNPNCPCAAMGGCSCNGCQCDAVRVQYLQRAGMSFPVQVQYQQPIQYAPPQYAQQYAQPAHYQQPAYNMPAYAPAVTYGGAYGYGGGYSRPAVRYGATVSGGCANGQCGVR